MKAICKNWDTGIAKGVIVDVVAYTNKPWDREAYTHTVISPSGSRISWTADGFADNFEVIEGETK